jgi:hypothetical protein
MTIKQLSIFLENKTGRINEVTKILGKGGINMQAFSMAETADFGILRLIVSDVEKAVELLHNASFAVMLTDVVCLNAPNVPGALSAMLEKLAENDIFIEYMYAFSEGETANIVIRTNDLDRCIDILSECQCTLIETV